MITSAINLTSIAAGLALGGLAAFIWRTLSLRLVAVDYWPSLARLAQSMFAQSDGGAFATEYFRMLKLLTQYIARNVKLLGSAYLPVVVFDCFLAPTAMGRPDDQASQGLNAAADVLWSGFGDLPLEFYMAVSAASVAGMIFSSRWRR